MFYWKYLCFLIVSCIYLSEGYHVHYENQLEVSTPLGRIKGSEMKSRLGRPISAFRGVRYGEPPTGELRFKPPVGVKPWEGVFDASQEGPSCPRPADNSSDEDCLRLNVYTTKLPNHRDFVRRPVIVFFHPGGFYSFSGQSSEYGPEYLMDKDVVLVTVNYRLASLGFLSTGDSLIPGNMGLKDQVAALRWVRDNIRNFGGDPNSVTISGYSAGSWSVILHMLSPMSRGLFHRAIAMSGSPTTHSKTPSEQKHYVVKQAEAVGCPSQNLAEAVACLRTKPAQSIADSFDKFNEYFGDPILRWRPVVEPEVPGVERFLPDSPENLIKQGKFAKVPLITGTDRDEFAGVVTIFLKGSLTKEYFDEYNGNWENVAPISFLYEKVKENPVRSKQISKAFQDFYLSGSLSRDNLDKIGELYADAHIIFSEHRLVNLLSPLNAIPIYYYNFVYPSRYSYYYYPNTTTSYGVCHHDELQYIFTMKGFPHLSANDPEIKAMERMTSIFEHFAKTGKPLPEHSDLFDNVQWQTFTPQNKAYLEIGEKLVMKDNLRKERMDFWDSLFPIHNS